MEIDELETEYTYCPLHNSVKPQIFFKHPYDEVPGKQSGTVITMIEF
jgi:hypothetical protein